MSRSTAVCAAVFFACTLALAFFSNDRSRGPTGSVLDRPAVVAPAASGPLTGAAQVPATSGPRASVPAAPALQPEPRASGAGAVPTR